MSDLPEPIREVLAAGPDTGEVLGALETHGEHAFVAEDGRWWRAPVWWVITDRHAWLAAAVDQRLWGLATGDPEQVHLEERWGRDRLTVGERTVPLPRGSRKRARDLMATWRAARWGGEAWSSEGEEREPDRAPLARGATGFPPWWADRVPAAPTERWLAAARTADEHPFDGPEGRVVEHDLWLGVGDHRAVLAARGPGDAIAVQPLEGPIERHARPGADRFAATPRSFQGPTLGGASLAEAAALTRHGAPAARWAARARQALDAREPERAMALWREAAELGRMDDAWEDVARLLLALDLGHPAVAALLAHLGGHPGVDARHGPARWSEGADRYERCARRLEASAVRRELADVLRAAPEPRTPERLPWPPRDRTEVWVAALVHLQRWNDARALLSRLGDESRSLAVRAAVRTAAGLAGTATDWHAAARAARAAGRHAEARRAIERSLELEDVADMRWEAAAWAWQDDDADRARAHWTRALELDPQGARFEAAPPLDAGGDRALADLAEAQGRPAVAAAAWARWLAAQGEVVDAAPDQPRWSLWIRLARLRAAAGELDDALDALHEAVAGDFLRPEAYRAALELEAVPVPAATADWWRHLLRLVGGAGEPEGAPLPPRTSFADDELDALHPGGAGWLDEVRTSLDLHDEPRYADVVRGLEQLTEAGWPATWSTLQGTAGRLGFADPPPTYLYRGAGAWGVSAWPLEPPVILLGYRHLDEGERHLDDPGLAFLLAIELTHLRSGHPLLAFEQDLVGTSRSAYATFGQYAGTAETVFDVVTLIPGIDQVAKLQTLIKLSRRVFAARGAVDKVSGLAGQALTWFSRGGDDGEPPAVAREGLRGAALQFRIQADRVALLATGDARAAVDAILRASSHSLPLADRVAEQGVGAVLSVQDGTDGLPPDEALRITMLLEFAAQRHPEAP